ncbi:uncharacterized protein MYCFIDRAFT_177626 [Pseudocercospora fijiensis CIRAD86]|uniref:Uncharacterized protein n=1 Tax=Pseudocercospora fijiensis (strain CIRAD86) TaxID=383855 RepID=M3A7V8_PSEFD|nr:uncharacterized protein MYCFIDRAFT_177626 [Pseudocercospora fijiensis CIRAD86]EME80691.1 hypothetical protein MYCFIDRAFT_177626 [Pseudocercospora fijiensis CIRAD86]
MASFPELVTCEMIQMTSPEGMLSIAVAAVESNAKVKGLSNFQPFQERPLSLLSSGDRKVTDNARCMRYIELKLDGMHRDSRPIHGYGNAGSIGYGTGFDNYPIFEVPSRRNGATSC